MDGEVRNIKFISRKMLLKHKYVSKKFKLKEN